MQLAWLTDIHLNALKPQTRMDYYQRIVDTGADGIVISGDIAQAKSLNDFLQEMVEHCQLPIYFVLGNHDYYHRPMQDVRNDMVELCNKYSLLHWLPLQEQWLSDDSVLVGCDGWADARHGDYFDSQMHDSDHRMPLDFAHHKITGKYSLLKKMQQVADNEVEQLSQQLNTLNGSTPEHIHIFTHFPPFEQSSFYKDKPSSPRHLPFYCCKALGDFLLEYASTHKDSNISVYCGHTHARSFFQPLPNCQVYTGFAEYGQTVIQRLIPI